ncbi:hypothetical protein AKJ16_DCAP04161 [Drosera capensis]
MDDGKGGQDYGKKENEQITRSLSSSKRGAIRRESRSGLSSDEVAKRHRPDPSPILPDLPGVVTFSFRVVL